MPRKRKSGDYEVGYGKPPKHSRFKSGQSGNPKGRPKDTKNMKTVLINALNEPVTLTENGRQRRITKAEASVARLLHMAMGGNVTALRLFLSLLPLVEDQSEEGPGQSLALPDERELVRRIVSRFAK
ncbi:DUF5681 domain-containing protein [Limibacillus sp. MBR-115]|uniref:DUF5681 domain-containing protein n=1 Tax=Limibacillus sp. MBR-115 TaxID=3156465 RepID=UPI00339B803C